MFGLLGSSQKLLYVLSDLLGLTDDILRARQRGIFLPPVWFHSIRGWRWAATKAKQKHFISVSSSMHYNA